MSNNNVLDNALSIIDKHILLNHKEIVRKIYAETGFCDQDYNKFIAVITSGELTLREYIRKRRLYFAVCDMISNPDKTLAFIAQEYDYSDQSAFTRAVKAEYRETPAELRKSKKKIPDNRFSLENYISNSSRLNSVIKRFETDNLSNTDWQYFEKFIHATDELGFDTSTCCLISKLSEKLSIPFGHLLEQCFEMAIHYEENKDEKINEIIDVMSELQIESQDELDDLCRYYDCKWYELTFVMVKMYQLKIDSEDEFYRIWKYYGCKWTLRNPYPITRQMVQDYRNTHNK